MSDIDHVETEILKPMQAIFLPPRKMDVAAQSDALRGYVVALRPFSAIDLHTAWIEIVASHMSRSWPVPAVIVLAARKAQKDRNPDAAPRAKHSGGNYSARWQTWLGVRISQIGADAVAAGVSWSLKCAVLHDGKHGGDINLSELIRAKASAEEIAQAIGGDGSPVMHNGRWMKFSESNRAIAMKMWTNQLKNEDDTADEIRRARSTLPAQRTAA